MNYCKRAIRDLGWQDVGINYCVCKKGSLDRLMSGLGLSGMASKGLDRKLGRKLQSIGLITKELR
eukprot:14782530-Heterocapsa_arctica.AAC.1